jgi:virulence-associated protein VapD
MATITLSYNAKNELINSILNAAILAGASVVKEKKTIIKQLTPFEESLEDIKQGRVSKVKNIDNIIEELLQ